VLAPHQTGGAAEGWEIHQLHSGAILDHRRRLASHTVGSLSAGLDMDPNRLIRVDSVDAEDVDVAESDKQLAHGGRVGFHRGSPF